MRNCFSVTLIVFSALANAHFNLEYPIARGFDEDTLGTFPCGGQDTVSTNRTTWPLSGGSIALTMGHIDADVEVLIAMGNDTGSAFNTVIRPTFTETGLGAFCMTGFHVPASLGVMDGMMATIQVVTNGDPDGGLYNCADIMFSSSAPNPSANVCKNATGVTSSTSTVKGNPNGTTTASSSTGTSSATGTGTSSDGFVRRRIGLESLVLVVLGAVGFAVMM